MKEWLLGGAGVAVIVTAAWWALRAIDRHLGDTDDTDDGYDREYRP